MTSSGNGLFTYRNSLELPVIGMESEFNVFVDGREVIPEEVWRHPSEFISDDLLRRTSKSSQLPTGGAIYFDKGVIEVVTPVIEVAPGCTSRMVRSVWEQIDYLRSQLTRWERDHERHVRLRAFSSHYNISYEIPRDERNRDRTIQKLALLLAYLLPVPVMLLGANRRSTGVGVRPRRDRLEVTLDFTPDPGLMLATAAAIVGIVREVISWPSYRLDELRGLELPADVEPGRHTTRKGWLTKDFHYPRSPFSSDVDAEVWTTTTGARRSLRQIAHGIIMHFLAPIRRYSDEFSTQLAVSVVEGKSPSLLDLDDRPAAYEDVGRRSRWGSVISELHNYEETTAVDLREWEEEPLSEHHARRLAERRRFLELGETADAPTGKDDGSDEDDDDWLMPPRRRRSADLHGVTAPPWNPADVERRRHMSPPPQGTERRQRQRRRAESPASSIDALSRSQYERTFLNLAARRPLLTGGRRLTPVSMRGWYEAVFQDQASGEERVIAIDELRKRLDAWEAGNEL